MGDLIERLKEARADLLRGGGYFDDGFICQSIDMAIEALQQPRLPEGMEVTPDVADTFAIQYTDSRGIKHRGIVNAQKNFPFYNFLSAFLPSTKPEETVSPQERKAFDVWWDAYPHKMDSDLPGHAEDLKEMARHAFTAGHQWAQPITSTKPEAEKKETLVEREPYRDLVKEFAAAAKNATAADQRSPHAMIVLLASIVDKRLRKLDERL